MANANRPKIVPIQVIGAFIFCVVERGREFLAPQTRASIGEQRSMHNSMISIRYYRFGPFFYISNTRTPEKESMIHCKPLKSIAADSTVAA